MPHQQHCTPVSQRLGRYSVCADNAQESFAECTRIHKTLLVHWEKIANITNWFCHCNDRIFNFSKWQRKIKRKVKMDLLQHAGYIRHIFFFLFLQWAIGRSVGRSFLSFFLPFLLSLDRQQVGFVFIPAKHMVPTCLSYCPFSPTCIIRKAWMLSYHRHTLT